MVTRGEGRRCPARGDVVGIPWDAFKTTPADDVTVRRWFPPDQLIGIGIACGPGSGVVRDGIPHGLGVIDIDDEQTLETFIESANFLGLDTLLQRLLHQRTPGGAGHFAYLCCAWAGNTKLAQRQTGIDQKGLPHVATLIETRGEGGQVVVAPTPPGIHPKHPERGYELIRGSWEVLPLITPEERQGSSIWPVRSTSTSNRRRSIRHGVPGARAPAGTGQAIA
jgi:putative DNA primase/helicase